MLVKLPNLQDLDVVTLGYLHDIYSSRQPLPELE